MREESDVTVFNQSTISALSRLPISWPRFKGKVKIVEIRGHSTLSCFVSSSFVSV